MVRKEGVEGNQRAWGTKSVFDFKITLQLRSQVLTSEIYGEIFLLKNNQCQYHFFVQGKGTFLVTFFKEKL